MTTKMKERTKTLWMLLGMYGLAIAVGIGVYLLVGAIVSNPLWQMLAADVAGTLVIWGFGLLVKNASTYDPYWSVIPPVIIVAWIIILGPRLTFGVSALILAIFFWSARLTYNWFINWEDFSHQDWRYTMIRNSKPKIWFLANLIGINMMPTVIVFAQLIGAYYLLTLAPTFHILIAIGCLMSIGAAVIQYISDKQMLRFRLLNPVEKRCINEGLWKYSRHPNYFGEVLMWWGVWVMYYGASGKINFLIFAPVSMTLLFLFISIPMMEKKIIATRPDYLEYRRSVSVLIPFFPRQKPENEVNETK